MHSKTHLHSMTVHAVAALLPVAAVAWLFGEARVSLGRLGPTLWQLLTASSLVIVLLTSIPATVTGIGERNTMYARWHRTHRLKLVLSLTLMLAVIAELVLLSRSPGPGAEAIVLGVLIVGVNIGLDLGLCALGLRITLGRQGLGHTSYVPDMFRVPPIDILEVNAGLKAEPAKILDPSSEARDSE